MEKLGMGAVLGVAQGSRNEPRFIELHYNQRCCGPRSPPQGMSRRQRGHVRLRRDLDQTLAEHERDEGRHGRGARSSWAPWRVASRLKLPVEIVGLIPCVENMPDGTAFRPGDVVVTHSGKTIEVISTDAEGRLILADALAYSLRFKPDIIVDVGDPHGFREHRPRDPDRGRHGQRSEDRRSRHRRGPSRR